MYFSCPVLFRYLGLKLVVCNKLKVVMWNRCCCCLLKLCDFAKSEAQPIANGLLIRAGWLTHEFRDFVDLIYVDFWIEMIKVSDIHIRLYCIALFH